MNKHTNKWAVEVGTPNLNEAVQLIAFQYGYSWGGTGWGRKSVGNTDSKFLVFNPTTKDITWASYRSDIEDRVQMVVADFSKVVELFKNPPVAEPEQPAGVKMPKVSFIYTSQSSGRRLRRLLVTEVTPYESIEGLDIDDGYRYKKFLTGKITGAVTFEGFGDEPKR